MLLHIQVKDEHCRQLEAALDGLDSELNKISRSRHELSILRMEEVEEDDGLSVTRDGALLTHLDSRLGHLEMEQRTLEEERTSLKVGNGYLDGCQKRRVKFVKLQRRTIFIWYLMLMTYLSAPPINYFPF